ncbi:hypothetical protein [Microbacterium lacticum]
MSDVVAKIDVKQAIRTLVLLANNGVLLCWYHHRFLERIGWQIRMNAGTPEVKAPSWHGTDRRWRPVTTSPMRLTQLVRRT